MRAIRRAIGTRIGRLTLLGEVEQRADQKRKRARRTYRFQCDCGKTVTKEWNDCRSCGCLSHDMIGAVGRSKRLKDEDAAFNRLFGTYQYGARKRGLEFALTQTEVRTLSKQPCHYCGVEPSNRMFRQNSKYGNGEPYIYSGLDRLDNEKGYVLDNVVPCCIQCNRTKWTMSKDQFYSWIVRVYKHSVGTGQIQA